MLEVKVEQPHMIELVEGLGVYVPAQCMLAAIRSAKKSSSALVRQLMDVVFSKEELAVSGESAVGLPCWYRYSVSTLLL